MHHPLASRLLARHASHPGRGGCGVGALVDLGGVARHAIVEMAIAGLGCLEHRGGSIADTGDGAGLLLGIDRDFFAPFVAPGRRLEEGHRLAVAVCFFPTGEAHNLPHWQHDIDATLRRHGLAPLGWRHVPVDEQALGAQARASRRDVWHLLAGEGMVAPEDLPRVLHKVKAHLELRVRDLYVASFSSTTLVYKALATGPQLARFYRDLGDARLRSPLALFHRRYSTNTFSNWYLAQLFRTLGHNGEINTIKANRNAVENLEAELGLSDVLMAQGSDSADVDRVVELFTSHGVSLLETLSRMMPRAWRDLERLTPETVRFYQGVQRALGALGAWEGPAAIVASDGRYVVGALDRMGLRPLRWMITRSGLALLGSEVGAVPLALDDVIETGQLDPGEAFAVKLSDKIEGPATVMRAQQILERVVAETPINFGALAEQALVPLTRRDAPSVSVASASGPGQAALNLFGWTSERVRTVRHMAKEGKEPITSMGYDRPLAAFSSLRPPLTKYFKQIVAVVTNPPIDPIREGSAFDLTVHLGEAPAVHENEPVYDPRPQYKLPSPFLAEDQFVRVRDAIGEDRPRAIVLDGTFLDGAGAGTAVGAKAMSRRIAELCRLGVDKVKRREASILVLSDRAALRPAGAHDEEAVPGATRLPLPMLLLTSALHNALVAEGLRRHAGLLVETGEVQEGHDASVLLANGADAIFPYLYFSVGEAHGTVANLVGALDESLKRVMSKMGICSLDGYRGSRLHEAVGVAPSVVEHYLPGVVSRIGGIDLEDLCADVRHRAALGASPQREPDVAVYRKEVWTELQTTARGHDPESFGRFLRLVEETPPVYLRDLLRLRPVPGQPPIPVEQTAGDGDVIKACFRGAAMSHGALHRVAHRAIAAAFNHYDAMSNCGEGGEDRRRDRGGPWEESRSRIRQVASGRFGVDARYLVHADEISIKIGQGAKPGEGGMLPGAKVTVEVAAIRKTQVGVTLISPPPHHDIYSIEDLAQLIHDLRQVNPTARVSVKMPAVTDIGTIAVGVAKAGADVIDVSGFEGGTGAAAASSIEHAGLPLERALSETHQALVFSGVRDRVRVRADGGIKTGYDVAAVLALGADEVSLGTALMMAEQCIFCHGCANGLCPAGITTQSPLVARRLMTLKKGRAKDEELPDVEEERYEDAKRGVMRYLEALARDLRRHLASVGLERPEQLVGRVDLLERRSDRVEPAGSDRAFLDERRAKIDLAEILTDPYAAIGERPRRDGVHRSPSLRVDPVGDLNRRLVEAAAAGERELALAIANTDRAVGATLAGRIALGAVAPPDGGFAFRFTGYAGQAFGFATVEGMHLSLVGYANDMVGEAMDGGTIALRPPSSTEPATRHALSLCGNASAYGATGGALFVEGRAGQRVGVRNSGATIVVEGAGKYAFEYMTGGVGVVLGSLGPVVGSGMTGGALYLLDAAPERLHADVTAGPLDGEDAERLRAILAEHVARTGSTRGRQLLEGGATALARFVKVTPKR